MPFYETEESVRQVLYEGYKGLNTDIIEKEEVTVKKKPVTETREVTEEVTSERISTDNY